MTVLCNQKQSHLFFETSASMIAVGKFRMYFTHTHHYASTYNQLSVLILSILFIIRLFLSFFFLFIFHFWFQSQQLQYSLLLNQKITVRSSIIFCSLCSQWKIDEISFTESWDEKQSMIIFIGVFCIIYYCMLCTTLITYNHTMF